MNYQRRSRNQRGQSQNSEPTDFKIQTWINQDNEFMKETKKIAQKMKNEKKTQLRKFYDEFVLADEAVSKINPENNEEGLKKILFRLNMLTSKISYQRSRQVLDGHLASFLEQLIQWTVKTNIPKKEQQERVQRAKLCFEAVYGFYGEGKQ